MKLNKIAGVVRGELEELPLGVLRNMPGRMGVKLRWQYWSRRLRHLGRGAVIGRNVHILKPEYVSIHDGAWIDDNVTILAGQPGERPVTFRLRGHDRSREGYLEIGAETHVAVGVVIQAHGGVTIAGGTGLAAGAVVYSLSHHYGNITDRDDRTGYLFTPMVAREKQSLVLGNIGMREGTAMAFNSVLLPGATLGAWSWLTIGAVLTGESPEGALLAGNPAKPVKYRPGFSAPEE